MTQWQLIIGTDVMLSSAGSIVLDNADSSVAMFDIKDNIYFKYITYAA